MSNVIDESSLRSILFAECASPGGQKAAARRLGLSAQYLSDVMHGRRALSVRMASALGYRRLVMFERSPEGDVNG